MTDKKRPGSGEYRAAGPAESTVPAPPDELTAKINEVYDALGRFGELAVELRAMLGDVKKVKLVQLASEHKLNTHRAKIIADRRLLGDHERRLREVEHLTKLLADAGTAAE